MPSQIRSIAPATVAFGLGIVVLLGAAVGLDYVHAHPAALTATVLLGLAVAAQGVKPFGDTVAYMLLLSGAFACSALTILVVDEPTATTGALAVAGLVGVLYYAVRAVQEGLWSCRNE